MKTRRGPRISRRSVDRLLGLVGRGCITAGLLLLGLVAYQLWGTAIETRRAQATLRDDFAALIATTPAVSVPDTTGGSAGSGTPVVSPIATPNRPNSAIALLEVPAAGIADIVVEGVSVSALRHGPAHIPGTAQPGEVGNSAIAGHRTTYGAPFADLDEVRTGDPVYVTTTSGKFTFEVIDSRIVAPERTEVLQPDGDRAMVTLITCHPRYSTSKRLVVTAELVSREPLPSSESTTSPPTSSKPASTTSPTTSITSTTLAPTDNVAVDEPFDTGLVKIDGWFSDRDAVLPTILLGAALAAIGWACGRWRRRLARGDFGRVAAFAIAWSVTALPFLFVLYWWYRYLNLLLPAST